MSHVSSRQSWGAICALLACMLAVVSAARGQTPTLTGTFTSFGGRVNGTGLQLTGESSVSIGLGRTASADGSVQGVGGFIGSVASLRTSASLATEALKFRLFSLSLGGTDNTVGTVFSGLGEYDTQYKAKVGHYDPATSQTVTLASGAALQPGLGYWVVTDAAHTAGYSGLPALPQAYTVALTGGPASAAAWNLLGNPFTFTVGVQDMTVSDGTTSYAVTSVNPLVDTPTLWLYGTQSTQAMGPLSTVDAREGFWLRRKGVTGTVSLTINPIPRTSTTSPVVPAKPAGATWAVAIVARQEGRASEALTLGAAPLPAAGRNPYCRPAAPAPSAEVLRLVTAHGDWGGESGEYVSDLQPAAAAGQFDFTLAGGTAPGEVALEITGWDLPADTRLQLVDAESGLASAVSAGQVVNVPARTMAHAYRLVVTARGTQDVTARAYVDGLRFTYPNPFTRAAGLAFALAKGGDAAFELFDLGGRRVRAVTLTGLSAGEHVWTWDGRSDRGQVLPAGVYLARWRTGSAHGVTRLVKVR